MVKVLRVGQVEEMTGLSRTTLWRREREGEFPPRRRIGPNAIGWISDEVEEWIRGRPVAESEVEAAHGAA